VETLAENARQILGLQLTPEQLAAFERYKSELIEWNNRFNLTAIRDESGIEIKHFLDSLTCILAFEPGNPPRSLIDVGTGAGFPGIPLKIDAPDFGRIHPEKSWILPAHCQYPWLAAGDGLSGAR